LTPRLARESHAALFAMEIRQSEHRPAELVARALAVLFAAGLGYLFGLLGSGFVYVFFDPGHGNREAAAWLYWGRWVGLAMFACPMTVLAVRTFPRRSS
jgi:hypothetical protein